MTRDRWSSARVALVHDWLTGLRGGERVLEQLCLRFPQAEIFTLIHLPGKSGPVIARHRIHTSFLSRLPQAELRYRHFLPLFPLAVERLDLRGFDLVLSTSHAVAKGCRPGPGALHVSYIHTPMRYAWDQFDAYFGPGRAGLPVRLAARAVMPWLRRWDVRSTARAQGLVANSAFVSGRCAQAWGRPADAVVYPPVEVRRFSPATDLTRAERGPDGYALILSALVPYKRVDLAVRTFSRLGRRLVVAGGGPELSRLRALAGPSVQVLGPVDDGEVARLMSRCAFFLLPGEEDFGIAPVEAQACGRPVLALGRGGARETVAEGRTGCFFAEPTEESLEEGLARIEPLAREADPQDLRRWAEGFAAERFLPRFEAALEAIAERVQGR